MKLVAKPPDPAKEKAGLAVGDTQAPAGKVRTVHNIKAGGSIVPSSFLAPGVPVATHKRELLVSATLALRASGARQLIRERLLPDDPTLAATPIGHRDCVAVAAIGAVEIIDGAVRGLFRLRPCALPIARR